MPFQTPLNNNIRELFNLMNFLDPSEWNDLDALTREYEDLTEEKIKELHAKLRPYFLRRIKSEVLQLPPKVCVMRSPREHLAYHVLERGYCAGQYDASSKGSIPVYSQYVSTAYACYRANGRDRSEC